MKLTPRFLRVAALCVALAPFAAAQQSATQEDSCDRTVLSAGPADHAIAACASLSEAPEVAPALRLASNAPAFGHDYQNSAFVRFEEDRPQVYGLVTPFNPSDFINAGDFRGNDLTIWYGLDAEGRAISVNANTGNVTNLGRIDPPNGQTWTAMTWDYRDQVFYALSADCGSETSLFVIDIDARTRTRVGPAEERDLLCGIALASDPTDGTLYAYGINTNQLVTISKSNGDVSIVGPLDFDPNFGQEMDFDNMTGTLFAYAYNNDTRRGELRMVDKANGNTTFLGRLGGAFPGGRNQIGAGSSRTPRDNFSVAASTEVESVPQGGTATFSYQVCNGVATRLSGELTYQLFLNGSPASPEVRVESGSVDGQTCLPELSFDLGVASGAQPGTYRVDISASPNNSNVTMTASLPLTVTASNGASEATWTVSDATPWPSLKSTVSAAATAAPNTVAAYPNPFARETTLTFSLDEAADVRLAVYDVLGRQVAVLTDGALEAGTHTATFEGRGLAVGTYIYRLVAGDAVQSGRITLVK